MEFGDDMDKTWLFKMISSFFVQVAATVSLFSARTDLEVLTGCFTKSQTTCLNSILWIERYNSNGIECYLQDTYCKGAFSLHVLPMFNTPARTFDSKFSWITTNFLS